MPQHGRAASRMTAAAFKAHLVCVPNGRERAVLIDGSSLWYAAQGGLAKADLADDRKHAQGTLSFVASLLNNVSFLDPAYCLVAFDFPGPTFRHRLYPRYKSRRGSWGDGPQAYDGFEHAKAALDYLQILYLALPGLEADDILGSMAARLSDRADVVVVSRDQDLLQLVSEHVFVLRPQVSERPALLMLLQSSACLAYQPRLVDLRLLAGDRSDTLPGVPGVGLRKARQLLSEYKDLNGIYQNLDRINPPLAARLRKHRDDVQLFQTLLRIRTDVALPMSVENIRLVNRDRLMTIRARNVLAAIGISTSPVPLQHMLW